MPFQKGYTPWNKGKRCSYMIGNTNGFKKGYTPHNKGEIGFRHNGSFKKGQISFNKGKKFPERSGKNHPGWKGGEYISNGYTYIH